jgi:hypothetical protein
MPKVHTLVCSVWWSMLVLRTVSACAEPGMAGMPRTDVPLSSQSQQAREPAGLTQQAPGTPVLPEAPAPTPAVANPTLIALADPSLASTAAKREQLKYLVRCALPADVALYADQDGTRFTFPGGLGLAPRWVDTAMTPSEERWVSACLLAHVNYFGTSVLVPMRATPPPVPALAVSDDESRSFSIFEGGFFGNLFTPEPVAYTCRGTRMPSQAHDPILQQRICTQETGETTAAGTPTTACRFLLTGPCEDSASRTVHGTMYTEVIFTYLRPSTPALEVFPGLPATSGPPGDPPYQILP